MVGLDNWKLFIWILYCLIGKYLNLIILLIFLCVVLVMFKFIFWEIILIGDLINSFFLVYKYVYGLFLIFG